MSVTRLQKMTGKYEVNSFHFHRFFFPKLFFKVLFIYLRERTQEWGEGQREKSVDSLLIREPYVGLDPRTLGS